MIQEDVDYSTPDGMLELHIPAGTTALTADGEPLQSIEVVEVCKDIPPPPPSAYVIGCAFDFNPDGATFDPPITMTIHYDPALIPEGIAEEDLVFAYYDVSTAQWVVLPSTVDTENHIITAQVSDFTLFAAYAESPAGVGWFGWWIIGIAIVLVAIALAGIFILMRARRRTQAG